MADSTHSRSLLLGIKARKKNSRILVHRQSDQFKNFVKRLRESNERVTTKIVEPAQSELVNA